MFHIFSPPARAIPAILLLTAGIYAAEYPLRLDLFDASDNNLMFITFEYENGRNTSRTIYASDSTFMRRVIISRNAGGSRTNEVSFNFNDDTSFVTRYQQSGTTTSMKIVDQFSVDQIGGTLDYTASGNNSYDATFPKTGTPAAKVTYESNADGTLRKVTVFNGKGQTQFYGVFTNGSVDIVPPNQPPNRACPAASLRLRGARQLELRLNLPASGEVRCQLTTLAGRAAGTLFNAPVKAGLQKLLVRADGNGSRRIADGVYLLTVSVDGMAVLRSRYLHQNKTTGGTR
jgi:hypothetical protein